MKYDATKDCVGIKASIKGSRDTGNYFFFFKFLSFFLKKKEPKSIAKIKFFHFLFFTDGLDFFFGFEPYARKLVDFLQSVVPCRYNTSKKLISHDQNSNTYNYKYVFSVEVVPICKDNVVCLPVRLARSLGMYKGSILKVDGYNCQHI